MSDELVPIPGPSCCHTCKEPFRDEDLIVPLDVNIVMPYGRFALTIFQHYLCGLGYYIDNLNNTTLTERDRMNVIQKLLSVVSAMTEGSIQ